MNILVTGGAGYIGSVMVCQLLDAGHGVVVVDDLSGGYQDAVDERAQLEVITLADREKINTVFLNHRFDAVMHFAGVISMAESMADPGKYFVVNTFNSINLLETMVRNGVDKIIFSSTAGVYGNPAKLPIPEDHPKNPTNPYGESKLATEKVLAWYDAIFGIRSINLRYFNAAGASLDAKLGENHTSESHIIPLAIRALLTDTEFTLFGSDYKTKDGTCVRDYIHVEDLCRAHLLALDALQNGAKSAAYNVGTGVGYTNKEVVATIEEVTGKTMRIRQMDRRPGDADELVADAGKIKQELQWSPHYSDLTTIVTAAWNYHQSHTS